MCKLFIQFIFLFIPNIVSAITWANNSGSCCIPMNSRQHDTHSAKSGMASTKADLPDSVYLKAMVKRNNDSLRSEIARKKDSVILMKKAGKYIRAGELCAEISDSYFSLDQYNPAKPLLYEAINFYKKAHSNQLQGIYSRLNAYYDNKGDYQTAVKYGLMAVNAGQALKDSSTTMCLVYSNIALTYNSTDDYINAEKFARIGASIAMKKKHISALYLLVSNIAFSLRETHRSSQAIAFLKKIAKDYPSLKHRDRLFLASSFINIYLVENRLDLARPYALEFAKMGKGPFDCICEYSHWFFTMTLYYRKNREYQKLRDFILTARPQQDLSANQRLIMLQRKYYADSAMGFFKEAMAERYKIGTTYDSLFRATKNLEISRLNIKFETERKNREILLQKAELERSDIMHRMFYYVITALVLIMGLLISRYRLKNRNNKELNQQKTIINTKNQRLQQLLREKEWLLKEIHHRVKNNLQIVMSLLNSQNAVLKDGVAFDAIQNSQARVNAMAIIHQKLYKSSDMSSIDLLDYITDLVNYFKMTYVVRQQVDFHLNLTSVEVDVAIAVPIALILNEGITNSLKYAFADGRAGFITVCLTKNADQIVTLTISDNGIGLPPDFDPVHQASLGMNLIKGLTEDIDGSYLINGIKGTSITITFCLDRITEHLVSTAEF